MKKNDFIMIGIILIIIVAGYLIINKVFIKEGQTVQVLVEGELIEAFSLDEDIEYKIESENGVNSLVIKDGTAYIEEASCPDKLCVHQKAISRAGESVICLPNKVVVKIAGDHSDVDSVAR